MERERVFPEKLFEWTVKRENGLSNKAITLYGEEAFDFLHSKEESQKTWQPGLAIEGSTELGPFAEWANDPPNASRDISFEICIYLQLKGTNYTSMYWPVWMRHNQSISGGWLVAPGAPLQAKEFLERFPNHIDDDFRNELERLSKKW